MFKGKIKGKIKKRNSERRTRNPEPGTQNPEPEPGNTEQNNAIHPIQ